MGFGTAASTVAMMAAAGIIIERAMSSVLAWARGVVRDDELDLPHRSAAIGALTHSAVLHYSRMLPDETNGSAG